MFILVVLTASGKNPARQPVGQKAVVFAQLRAQLGSPPGVVERLWTKPAALRREVNGTTRSLRRQRHLTKAQMKDLVAAYEAGELTKDLALTFHVDRQTVSAILKRHQVPRRPKGLNSEQVHQAVELYCQGASVATIAKEFGVDAKTVWSRLKERGVKMRDTHGRERS